MTLVGDVGVNVLVLRREILATKEHSISRAMHHAHASDPVGTSHFRRRLLRFEMGQK